MKSLLKLCFVISVIVLANMPAKAQDEKSNKTAVPRCVPEAGHWVAENNPHKPKQYTIYFYTNNHELVYKEKIEGVKLNLDSRRVKMRLKKVLETSLLAWREQRQPKENEGLVISLLHRK